MKKIITILWVCVLLLALVACSTEDASVEKTESSSSNVVAEGEEVDEEVDETKVEAEISSESKEEQQTEEVVVEEEAIETEEEEEEEEVPVFLLDSSLTGLDLLSSITYTMPDSYISVTESVAADGSVGRVKTYSKGMFLRTESMDENGEMQIAIYNPELGVDWMYSEGQAFGVEMYDEDDEEFVEEFNVEGATYADVFSGEDLGNFEAKIDVLDGEEMLYVQMAQDDGMGGVMDVLMWYAPETGAVMKYEMYSNGALIVASKVVEYEANVDIDDSLFDKPEGIEFMGF